MKENIVFLAGLPRTGSTLLTSILSQNPEIHTAGNSALCPLMWEMQDACSRTEQIMNRPDIPDKFIGSMPEIFYKDVHSSIIIDKCRTWTLQPNIELIYKYINLNPKIIVMNRPIIDVIKSIIYIRKMNNWKNPEYKLLDDDGEFLMRPLQSVYNSLFLNQEHILHIQYSNLIEDTENTLKKVYDFI
jgi:sulfotransferase